MQLDFYVSSEVDVKKSNRKTYAAKEETEGGCQMISPLGQKIDNDVAIAFAKYSNTKNNERHKIKKNTQSKKEYM